jgi:hypothetical protein
MGKIGPIARLIGESICYHSVTDPDVQEARATRFSQAARGESGSIRLERLSEEFFARERVA